MHQNYSHTNTPFSNFNTVLKISKKRDLGG